MEAPVCTLPLFRITAGTTDFGLTQISEGPSHGCLPHRIANADRLTQGLGLQLHPGVGEVTKIVQRNRTDAITTLALDRDQRVRHQQRQRLTQRASAHVVPILEVLDPQAFTRLQIATDDVVAQCSVGAFGQGARLWLVASGHGTGRAGRLKQFLPHGVVLFRGCRILAAA